jgi:hypothetical protein
MKSSARKGEDACMQFIRLLEIIEEAPWRKGKKKSA